MPPYPHTSIPPYPLLLLLLLLLPLKAGAQPITAREALEYAEANSPALGRLRAMLVGERARRLGAVGISNPQVVYAREGIPNDAGGFGEQRWMIQQSIDSPVETFYRIKQYAAQRTAIEHEFEAERVVLRERVKLAYLEFLVAHARVRLRRQSVTLADSLVAIVSARIQANDAAELDRLRMQLEQATAAGALDDAERNRRAACTDLLQAIGQPLEGDRCSLTPADSLRYMAVDVPEQGPALSTVLTPQMAGAEAALNAARFNTRRARGAVWPRFHVNYWPQDFGGGYTFHGFEIGFSVPLWYTFNQRSAVAVARAEEQQRNWTRQEIAVQEQSERARAWEQYEASRATVERYLQTTNTRAVATLAMTRRGYELGELNLLALLDMQRTFNTVRLQFIESLASYVADAIRLERFLENEVVF